MRRTLLALLVFMTLVVSCVSIEVRAVEVVSAEGLVTLRTGIWKLEGEPTEEIQQLNCTLLQVEGTVSGVEGAPDELMVLTEQAVVTLMCDKDFDPAFDLKFRRLGDVPSTEPSI
jgi:hypothetical protein